MLISDLPNEVENQTAAYRVSDWKWRMIAGKGDGLASDQSDHRKNGCGIFALVHEMPCELHTAD
jgi:hypothetical protein